MSRPRVLALKPLLVIERVGGRQTNPLSIYSHLNRSRSILDIRKRPAANHLLIAHLRHASTSRTIASDGRSLVTRLKNLALGAVIGLSLTLGYYYITDTRAGVHQWVVVPALRWIYDDAEDAHEAGTKALRGLYHFGIHPRERGEPDRLGDLSVEVFGHTLHNPIGTSAGIDKHAEIPTPLLALGPSVIEIGGATPYPQDGNPKPRVFRLPSQNALINRYGLNSEGADDMAMRLRQRVREHAYAMGFGIDEIGEQRVLDGEAGVPPGSLADGKLMAVQIAKNKFTPDDNIEAVKKDYVYCVEALARYADIIVVNVSSPNTPGLRGLQRVEPLTNILTGVVEAARRTDRKSPPAVMVKVSPDEDSDEQVSGICEAIWKSGVDGVIVGNTTTRRTEALPGGYSLPNKEAALMLEQGGYSGPQLFERTVSLVKRYRQLLDEGRIRNSEQRPPSLENPSFPPALENAGSSRHSAESSQQDNLQDDLAKRIEATVQRDKAHLKEPTISAEEQSKSQPLIRLPSRNSIFASDDANMGDSLPLSSSTHIDQLPPLKAIDDVASSDKSSHPSSSIEQEKVIFATGGITNGKQALEVLNAGASVAMIYTALVYSGVGTISRIKGEMRQEMQQQRK